MHISPASPSSRPGSFPRAFTLIEVLTVLVILGVVIALATPTVLHLSAANSLTSAGDLVLNRLSEAQQLAVASDTEVEVRFYEQTTQGEVDKTPRIRFLQTYSLQPETDGVGSGATGDFKPVSEVTKIPIGVVISGKDKLSSLVKRGYKTENEGVGDATVEKRYLWVRFLPDGSTDLLPPANQIPWFFTLVQESSEAFDQVTPANFYAVQVDHATGRLRTFRP